MSEEINFITLSKVPKISLKGVSPALIALSYPLLAISTSKNEIITFNFKTKESQFLQRKEEEPNNIILCIAVSSDCSTVATGYKNGEIVLWSMETKSPILSQKMKEAISFITFSKGKNTIVYSTISGSVFVSTIAAFLFRKTLNTVLIQDFGIPLTSLCSNRNYIFISSSDGTICLDASNNFSVVFSDKEAAVCYAFYKNSLVARGVDHKVVITDFKGDNKKVLNFSQTPSSLSMISPNTLIVLYNGFCEMCISDRRFTKEVATGRSIAQNGKIFVASAENLIQITIASISDRVNTYIVEGNWKAAFDIVKHPSDVSDIVAFYDLYVNSDYFDVEFLFKNVEKLHTQYYITNLMMPSKFEVILNHFAKVMPKWPINLDFIEALDKTVDDEKLLAFFEKNELCVNWIPRIIMICLRRSFFELAGKLAGDDVYLSLKIAEYSSDAKRIHEILGCLEEGGPHCIDAIKFLIEGNLVVFFAYDQQNAGKIIKNALTICQEIRADIDALVNNIIRNLITDSPIWETVVEFIENTHIIIIEKDAVIDYIVNGEGEKRENLLHFMIFSSQLKNYEELLLIARSAGFNNVELEIINILGNTKELIRFLVIHKETSFVTFLKNVAHENYEKELLDNSDAFMAINADEFVSEVMKINDESRQEEFFNKMSNNWHFIVRATKNSIFMENSNESTLINALEQICTYTPNEALSFVERARKLSPNNAVKVTESAGVLDATLYLYMMMNDTDHACSLVKSALESDLMEESEEVSLEVADFLTEVNENAKDLWFSALDAFQLPLVANAEKTIPTLVKFVHSMAQMTDNSTMSQKLVSMMSFLPFSITKPVFKEFFTISKERGQFGAAFSRIKHSEAVENSIKSINNASRGKLVEAKLCMSCNKPLFGNVVVCGCCGQCYHDSCVHGWCEKCGRALNTYFRRDLPAMRKIQKFEQIEEDGLRRVNVVQKEKRERTLPLPKPGIGISVTKL